ncbi:glycoside hydrolase superfamily [Bisporella sp. PMI_857]|nr:glycoside hydrolase superfamily [Bisporella sp. PMI_857]
MDVNSACFVTQALANELSSEGFSWPAYPKLSYAASRTKLHPIPTYAKPFSKLSSLVKNQTTTTWASIALPTDSAAKYGNVAWSSLWKDFNITAPPFTTTVSPKPIASSELVKPTPPPFPINDSLTDHYKFPDGFLWGYAGAALQIEGAVKNEGRGPSYTELELRPREENSPGGGPPDISNLNYYYYKQDIARLAALNVQTYSFSISWSRILPFGVAGSPVNKQAIDHYDDLINTILEYGLTPIATLNHFDTPLYFATNTSWQGYDHPEFIDSFVNYAQIVLTHYSDRVGHWITFNEPGVDTLSGSWKSAYNIVLAHAKVVHWYREQIRGTGKWSFKLSFSNGFALPLEPSDPKDVAAANRQLEFAIGYLANPVYLGKQVPQSVLTTLGSKAPIFTDSELAYAKGTCDFIAVDYYSATYHTPPIGGIDACAHNSSNPAFPACTVVHSSHNGWALQPYQHLRITLKYLDSTYPTKGGVMITETGLPTYEASSMTVDALKIDYQQTGYYLGILREVLKSVHEDGVTVAGIIGWTFVDNWEWGQYASHYGVQSFDNVTLERYYKRAIFDFSDFMIAHGGK